MDNAEYAFVQGRLAQIAKLVQDLPLGEFLVAIERADSVGQIIDPTLWKMGHENMYRFRDLARAARLFQVAAREFLD